MFTLSSESLAEKLQLVKSTRPHLDKVLFRVLLCNCTWICSSPIPTPRASLMVFLVLFANLFQHIISSRMKGHSLLGLTLLCIPPGCDTGVKTPSPLLGFLCWDQLRRLLMFSCNVANRARLGHIQRHKHSVNFGRTWGRYVGQAESWFVVVAFQLFHKLISNWVSDMNGGHLVYRTLRICTMFSQYSNIN